MRRPHAPPARARSPARTALFVAIAMASFAIGSIAQADSGVGVDLWLANKYDPAGGTSAWSRDARGTSWLVAGERRTPTGYLYQCPVEPPPSVESGHAWRTWGLLQFGYLGASGDTDNAIFQRYNDWPDGSPALPLAEFHAQKPEDGRYVDVRASYLRAHDNYLKATVGRAGAFRVEAFTRATPNVVSGNARSIWNGVGTDRLTLVEGLTPAASTPAQVVAASNAAPERRLQVNRDKQGLGFNYFFDRQWTAYANVTNETREGARPFGGAFFFNYPFPDNGGVYEVPRPIDDATINTNVGVRFAGNAWRMDLGYSGSFYRSRYTSFDYEVPYALWNVVQGPDVRTSQLTSGQFSSEPDNDYHNLRATLTRALPMNGQLSLSAAGATMRQNDDLVPPIGCNTTFGIDLAGTGVPGADNPFLYSCADWNSPASLSRDTAEMKIDTTLIDARVVLQPTDALTWRGGLRFYREDYRNTYLAYNPLTGEYGYVAENGAQGSIVPGEAGVWNPVTGASILTRVSSLPLDTQNTEANVGTDWRLGEKNTLGATVSFTRNEPEHRERERVDDTTLKLSWTNRAFDRLTFRANYVYLQREGDAYDYDPYGFTFSEALPGFVEPEGGVPAHTVDAMRKYDLADRDEHKIDLMTTFAARDDMTLSASVRADWNDYDATIGRRRLDTMGATLQWEWQPSPQTGASVFVGYDRSKLGIANVNDGEALDPDPTLGGSAYALANRWWVDDTQRNHSLGSTFTHDFGRARLDASWNWNRSRGSTDYRFASPSALAYFSEGAAGANSFPEMTYRVTTLSVALTIPISKRSALRVFDAYETGRIDDWHYDGFDSIGRVFDHRVYTDGGPEGYDANLIGVMLTVQL